MVILYNINCQLDAFIDCIEFTVHCLHPHLHVALEQVTEQLLRVASEEMDGHRRGKGANDATNCDVVVLTFDDHFREPDLVPGALNELSYEVVLRYRVHWVAAGVVEGTYEWGDARCISSS